MKKLTINRIAAAGLRTNKRGYLSLAVGIFLSIFLITTLCLCAQGLYLAQAQKTADQFGYADCFVLDALEPVNAKLRETDMFDKAGSIIITARAADTEQYIGFYDDAATEIMNRHLVEGRLPEKPGEIAMELSALEPLRLDAKVGDTVTLRFTPIDGQTEERSFTLVGILTEQASVFNNSGYGLITSSRTFLLKFPSIMMHEEEPAFLSGRLIQHRVMTLKAGYTQQNASDYFYYNDGYFCILTAEGRLENWINLMPSLDGNANTILTWLIILFTALILVTCVGISGAMEGQLARKTQEIGMLRAVGATKRQIKRIFGREAYLLALVIAPLAAVAGCLVAWLLSTLAPDQLIFSLSPILLIPILLFSVLCILVSSGLPLRRACAIMPMGVLRNTALMRKTKSFRSKNSFVVPRLIAWRQNRLHPTRQLGAGVLVGLMLILSILLVVVTSMYYQPQLWQPAPFELYSMNFPQTDEFSRFAYRETLTEQDINQLRALNGVTRVDTIRKQQVSLLMDTVPGYFLRSESGDTKYTHLKTAEQYIADMQINLDMWYRGNPPLSATQKQNILESYMGVWERSCARHNEVREVLDTPKNVIAYELSVLSFDVTRLAPFVTQGKIDIQALDEGRQVLVYAPDIYELFLPEKDYYQRTFYEEPKQWTSCNKNDAFAVGQALSIAQLFTYDEALWRDIMLYEHTSPPADGYQNFYAQMDARTATTSVGAVLSGNTSGVMYLSPCIITTERGMQALGLRPGEYDSVNIYTVDDLDKETETQLAQRIERIGMRDSNMHFYNRLEQARESSIQQQSILLILSSIIVLFFAVSVSMITSGVTRRIRADVRMIGTLRAVGADEKAIMGCYRLQVTLSVLVGLVISGIFLLVMVLIEYETLFRSAIFLILLVVSGFAALCLLACQGVLRLRIRETMRRSIVENIREL